MVIRENEFGEELLPTAAQILDRFDAAADWLDGEVRRASAYR
jgi:hypothetical protein